MSSGSAPGTSTSSIGATARLALVRTRSLNASRSCSRRICQNARLTITTTATSTSKVNAIHLGFNRKRYIRQGLSQIIAWRSFEPSTTADGGLRSMCPMRPR